MPLTPQNYFAQAGVFPVVEQGISSISLPITLAPNLSLPKGTILGEKTGQDDIWTLASSAASFTITVNGQTTASITQNATAAQVIAALNALSGLSTSSIQTLTQTATAGTFILSVGGNFTPSLAWNSTAAQIQTALANLPNVGAGNVTCTGGPLNSGAVTVTFGGFLAGTWQPPIGINNSLLTGGSLTQATVANGGESIVGATGGVLNTNPIVITFKNSASNTVTSTATINHTQTGSAGTIGQFTTYNQFNTDGSQVPKCVLQFDCTTDANGNITSGQQTGGQGGGGFGQISLTCPAWFQGVFRVSDLVGLDPNSLSPSVSGWRLVQGNMSNPQQAMVAIGV